MEIFAFICIAVVIILIVNLLIHRKKQDSHIHDLRKELIKAQNKIGQADEKIISKNDMIKKSQKSIAELTQQSTIYYRLFSEISRADLLAENILFGDKKKDVLLHIHLQNIFVLKKLEKNKYPLKIEKVSLEEIIKGLNVLFTPLEFADRISLEYSQDVVKEISTDASLLQLVLLNLLFNAFTHSGLNEPVKLNIKDIGENQLQLKIIDFGKGIPRKHHKMVFQKYFHIHNNSICGIEPAGLGLYVCDLALEKLGGKITLISKEEEGASFIVKLPIDNNLA